MNHTRDSSELEQATTQLHCDDFWELSKNHCDEKFLDVSGNEDLILMNHRCDSSEWESCCWKFVGMGLMLLEIRRTGTHVAGNPSE